MKVEANTSSYATREVLSVRYGNEKWKLVVFIFKSLNTTEYNYKIHNKKMLTVI